MRKFISILVVFVIIIGIPAAFLHYIKPQQALNMEFTSIALEEKIVQMAREFKPELRLSRSDMNALIKQNMKQELSSQVYIDGVDFYLQDSLLHGQLNVTFANTVKSELSVVYTMNWEYPNIILEPKSLSIKSIPLPIKWLERFEIPIDNEEQRFVKIKEVYNEGDELVIAFKVQIF